MYNKRYRNSVILLLFTSVFQIYWVSYKIIFKEQTTIELIVGSGKPITRGLHRYERSEIPLVVYDSEGYEISEHGEIDATKSEQIYLVWYCISISNHRMISKPRSGVITKKGSVALYLL